MVSVIPILEYMYIIIFILTFHVSIIIFNSNKIKTTVIKLQNQIQLNAVKANGNKLKN